MATTLAGPRRPPSKDERYRDLVRDRKACSNCRLPMRNPAQDPILASFDSEHLGPFTRWHHDLNAKVMVVGQDWGCSKNYLRQGGKDVASVTNKNLRHLLRSVSPLLDPGIPPGDGGPGQDDSGLFFSNAVLCIKDGEDTSYVPAACRRNCRQFLRRTIDLVEPHVVVTLGGSAYEAVLTAYGLKPPASLTEALSTPGVPINARSCAVPVWHCGGTGTANRALVRQVVDWARVAARLP